MKKLFKKSIACLIAVLMVVSVMPLTMPLTTPVSVEAADVSSIQSLKFDKATASAKGYHYGNEAKGGYDNILYCSKTTLCENDFVSVGDNGNFKTFSPNVVVMMYDGTTAGFPITVECKSAKCNNQYNLRYIQWNGSSLLEFQHPWYGYNEESWTSWPNYNASNKIQEIPVTSTTKKIEMANSTSKFYSNEVYYKGTGNSTDYYESISGTTVKIDVNESTGNKNTNSSIYILDYNTFYSKVETVKSIQKSLVDYPNRYTPTSSEQAISAVNAYYNANERVKTAFNSVDDTNAASTVTSVATDMKNAVAAINAVNLVCAHSKTRIEGAQAATCATAGKSGNVYCDYCDILMESSYDIPATGKHNYTEKVSDEVPANCTTTGTTAVYKCATCDATTGGAEIAINPNNHTGLTTLEAKDATCTATGLTQGQKCTACGVITIPQEIVDKKPHTWDDWVYDANKQEKHSCTVCGTVDSKKRDCVYVEKSVTPATCIAEGKRVYRCTQCGNEYDEILPVNLEAHNTATREETTNATCTVAGKKETVTYCTLCNKEISRVKTEDIPVLAHNYGEPVYDAETNSDVFTCKNCGNTYSKTVAKMEELNAAIDELEALVNADDAAYKYEASALAAAKEAVANAKAYAENKENKYKEQGLVDAETDKVLTAETNLKDALAEYTVKFELYNYDDGSQIGDTVSVTKKYGEVAEKSYTFDKTEEGFPEYVVGKWTKKVLNDKGEQVETVLNSTANDMSVVVKENATYTCYVLKFKASTEGENATTRVRYLDKSGKTLKIDYATVGTTYTPNYSKVPKIPYYRFTEWKRVYGEDTPVGTRELVYQAQYEYDEVEANNCTIVGRGGISVNGSSQCTSRYDDKVILTGADKYAFCDENGNIISYINADYIYTPHINGTVYITKVETASTQASTAVTGYFKQLNTGTTTGGTPINTLYVNAQYYLPEGAMAVEAGIVISSQQKTTETLVIGGAGVLKVISDTQGTNHEYSIGMTYTKTGTLYTRSYLICKLSDGTTKTVYSDDVTEVNL